MIKYNDIELNEEYSLFKDPVNTSYLKYIQYAIKEVPVYKVGEDITNSILGEPYIIIYIVDSLTIMGVAQLESEFNITKYGDIDLEIMSRFQPLLNDNEIPKVFVSNIDIKREEIINNL